MPVSTLTSKYQATIPRAVRDVLSLRAGNRIEFIIQGNAVTLRRAPPAYAALRALETTLAPEWGSEEDCTASATAFRAVT